MYTHSCGYVFKKSKFYGIVSGKWQQPTKRCEVVQRDKEGGGEKLATNCFSMPVVILHVPESVCYWIVCVCVYVDFVCVHCS